MYRKSYKSDLVKDVVVANMPPYPEKHTLAKIESLSLHFGEQRLCQINENELVTFIDDQVSRSVARTNTGKKEFVKEFGSLLQHPEYGIQFLYIGSTHKSVCNIRPKSREETVANPSTAKNQEAEQTVSQSSSSSFFQVEPESSREPNPLISGVVFSGDTPLGPTTNWGRPRASDYFDELAAIEPPKKSSGERSRTSRWDR